MKFSVLLPTRNRLELLRFAIETVQRQDDKNWEIVVSDNASQEDVRGFVESLGDDRIVYVRSETSIPVTDNWNLALSRCTGDYVVMLGDDDGLLPGFFTRARQLIEAYGAPEVLYTNALLYAYPGVLPDIPDGSLRSYEERGIFKGEKSPFLLPIENAHGYVDASLDFRVEFDYNMQFFIVSRTAVERLSKYGPFYQSPYPDYYAANALLYLAASILVVPTPMVVIGISPKSFGYYYFNDNESAGTAFLDNMGVRQELAHLDQVVLPGTGMNTCWLMAMETFAIRFGRTANHRRYRELQIRLVLSGILRRGKRLGSEFSALYRKATWHEKLRFLWPLYLLNPWLRGRLRFILASLLVVRGRSHPRFHMPHIAGRFSNMLQVYEHFVTDSETPCEL